MNESKSNSEFLITVVAMVVLAFLTVAGMVTIFIFVQDATRAIALAGMVSGVTVPIIGFGAVYLKTAQNRDRIEQTTRKVDQVGVKVDGRLEELLKLTASANELAGHAAGLKEGHAAGMVDGQALEAASQSLPPLR